MFINFRLCHKTNLFEQLASSTEFEEVIKGRMGAVLTSVSSDGNISTLVRTTTKYSKPTQQFHPLHYQIIDKIKEHSGLDELQFNNAMIEIYDSRYSKMGFHSDQALDLAEDSYIAIYTCYKDPTLLNSRKLIIKNKKYDDKLELIMEHDSVILFSVSTNSKYLHKIVADTYDTNEWLGITFRLSKTYLKWIGDNISSTPFLLESPLKLANADEAKQFYKLRGKENKVVEFEYPALNFTISPSDLMPVTRATELVLDSPPHSC